MHDSEQNIEEIPEAIHEVVRSMVSAIRTVKLYPRNNPIYSQTVSKSYASLDRCLKTAPEVRFSVQKAGFSYLNQLMDREMQLHKTIAGDLFQKGIREVTFFRGITEDELLSFYKAISLSQDELNLSGGIGSLLWEQGASHITITSASLDEVVRQGYAEQAHQDGGSGTQAPSAELKEYLRGRELDLFGRRVILFDLTENPLRFGSLMVDMAGQAGGTQEAQSERLLELYREAGSQIMREPWETQDMMFQALAESILSMEPALQEGLIAKGLYVEFDGGTMQARMKDVLEQIPHGFAELTSARFARSWTVPQVSALLKKTASARVSSTPAAPAMRHLPLDIQELSRELSVYTPEEMEELRKTGEYGQERDSLEATVHTLTRMLPLLQHSLHGQSPERSPEQFSRAVGLLEDVLAVLLERKDYVLAASIVRVFRISAEPALRPRLADALKKAGDRKKIAHLVENLRSISKDSVDYHAIYSYLSLLDREATPVLLEMLAGEEDRSVRKFLVQLLKDLGKNQIALLGEKLSDERWYYVRNIVGILGESRREEVVSYLQRVAGHKNFQIRQEVVRALITIGGKKAAELMVRFLRDRDIDIRFMAVRGLGMMADAGEKEARALVGLLKSGGMRGIGHELKKEAIESLGRVGGPEFIPFLRKYETVRWWKARQPQEEIRAAARRAAEDIQRRFGNAGPAKASA